MTEVMRVKLARAETYQRSALGIAVTLASLAALLALLLSFRPHLSVAIPALVFVVPALLGTVVGGFLPGAVGAVAGFLAYDWFFLPPYGTLTVRSPQNWITLVVYVAVVLIVAQVVSQLRRARAVSDRRSEEAGRVYELSRALIGDLPLRDLLVQIAETVQGVFGARWTALVLPGDGRDALEPGDFLEVAAVAGDPLTPSDEASLTHGGGHAVSLGLETGSGVRRVSVALVVSHRPVGMLVLQDVELDDRERNLLGTFANQAALALDRAQLRERALRTQLLEEVDRWRSALLGAVSHDLRTPLAAIKAAVSSLRQPGVRLDAGDRAELLELIELQSDRLDRLVTDLLDMTRIESGALEVRPASVAFDALVTEALDSLGGLVAAERVTIDAPHDLPLPHVDHLLISRVLANVLENAGRLSPPGSPVRVAARVGGSERVEISVSDEGPGIAAAERERVFQMFSQNAGGGRAGLGLAIAKAFIEAHGGAIWVDPDTARGTRVAFTVPCETLAPSAALSPS